VSVNKFFSVEVAVVVVAYHVFPPADSHLQTRHGKFQNVLVVNVEEKVIASAGLGYWSARLVKVWESLYLGVVFYASTKAVKEESLQFG
jgi:hypothetical protein